MSESGNLRRDVHFSGRVQGVGFRYTTRSTARGFDVSGYVQNLPDGRVRLVAEGTASELDRFLSAIETEMGGYIAQKHVETSSATGEFDDFGILF